MSTTWKSTVLAIGYLGLGLLLAGCMPIAPTPSGRATPEPSPNVAHEPIAIITYIAGDVFVQEQEPTVQRRAPGLMAQPRPREARARAFQELRDGSTVRTETEGNATIVCYNNQAYRVTGGSQVAVNSASCGSAQPLPPNSVPAVAPDKGRLIENDGSSVIEGETRERESDYGQLPVILSPRNTALSTQAPAIGWVEVSGALEYELSLSGLSSFDNIVLNADELACDADQRTASNRICTQAWPATWALEPGARYFLTISARTGIATPLRASEVSALRTLAADEAEQVQTVVAQIEALAVDPVTRNLLLAGLYREHGLLDAAIAAYVAAQTEQPTAEVNVALGDLYLKVDLQRFALRAYQDTLDQLATAEKDNPAARAAAEFGIGLVYYSRANYAEAEPHFVEAVELYTQIGAESERNAAQAALQATRERLS